MAVSWTGWFLGGWWEVALGSLSVIVALMFAYLWAEERARRVVDASSPMALGDDEDDA